MLDQETWKMFLKHNFSYEEKRKIQAVGNETQSCLSVSTWRAFFRACVSLLGTSLKTEPD